MITSLQHLPVLRDKHKNEIIAFAGGVFDLLHPGHIDLFKRMKTVADIVVVAVTSDMRVKQRKGPRRPIQPQNTRLLVADAIRYVDYALVAPEPTKNDVPTVQIMRELHPDVFVSSDNSWLNHQTVFEQLGVEFLLVPRFSEEISTTRTIEDVLKHYTK